MKSYFLKISIGVIFIFSLLQCNRDEVNFPINPKVDVRFPSNFPARNSNLKDFEITEYGVQLGKKLFEDKRLSADNTVSCASCHIQQNAFAEQGIPISIGIQGLKGFRNAPAIQNMYWIKEYMWDGAVTDLAQQPIIPITAEVEMGNTISKAISKIEGDKDYQQLFYKAYNNETINATKVLNAITQYVLTLVSADSKYDKVMRKEGESFTQSEAEGYQVFQQKCVSCHSTALFTDNTFRNVGFPINPNLDVNGNPEEGRSRVTGLAADYQSFRVPSLRNVEYTAPYGSFGQFPTLKAVLDYFDNGVLNAQNLDPIFKNNGNKIPLTEQEKINLIAFMKTLSDHKFVGK